MKQRNCGICGETTCDNFIIAVKKGTKNVEDCPFNNSDYVISQNLISESETEYEEVDTHGYKIDFVLKPISNELSARKIIRPFRPDLIEKLSIKEGSYVMGRPMGAGCPVTHILKVYEIDKLSGVLYTWAVGPKYSRENNIIDIRSYNMIGFEGVAVNIKQFPKIGKTSVFLPSFCMLRLTHYGLVNKILNTSQGLIVRIEDIHIART